MKIYLAARVVAGCLAIGAAAGVYDYGYMQGRTEAWIAAGKVIATEQAAMIEQMDNSMLIRPAEMAPEDRAWSDNVYSSVKNRRVNMNLDTQFPVPISIVIALFVLAGGAAVVDLSRPNEPKV